MSNQLEALAALLLRHHGLNINNVLCTDYAAISSLNVHASTTNGTSGLGIWRGQHVYWCLDSGLRWNQTTHNLDRVAEPAFIVRPTDSNWRDLRN